jgi:glycosyltransferase involved in cell wall biosynthesis
MINNNLISVILPTFNFIESTSKALDALACQTLSPSEVIIIDSSPNHGIEDLAKKYEDRLNIVYFSIPKAYPGEARNIGISKAAGRYIGFLDSKTIPKPEWISDAMQKISQENLDLEFGSTNYLANSKLQKIFQASIYGKKPVETTPGTFISLDAMKQIGNFIEGVRASDDLEWRNRIKASNLRYSSPMTGVLSYSEISKDLWSEIKRHFIYQFHSALTEVQINTKIFVMGISLLLISLIIPHWNGIVGWKDSIFYIPHITRGFFYIFSILSIIVLFSSKFLKFRTTLSKVIAAIMAMLFLNFVTQWNEVMANWVDESFLYIPHITKFYIFGLVFIAFVYRGIISPIRGGFTILDLAPLNWLAYGIVGFILDLVKIPGYFFGALVALFRVFR